MLERIGQVSDLDGLRHAAQNAVEALGMRGYYFAVSDPAKVRHMVDDRPKEWLDRYRHKGYFAFDPVYTAMLGRTRTFTWDEVYAESDLSRPAFQKLQEGREFGLTNGLVIKHNRGPHDRSAFCYYSDADRDFFHLVKAKRPSLVGVSHAIIEKYKSMMGPTATLPVLSGREIECLNWASAGKTNDEIAGILSISSSTVNSHLQKAGLKLGTHTKISAIVKAVQLGIVSPHY
ncbi:helix-turn-helix transcriptional regulator [Gimibacter soli]|uniref:LuxR C-terminal-related transcriptional regulator n=1 Tax=Gimibacter soli TaxID=3024400 RepID=A0AAF0BKE3_9PROT|nr:LuxR family transcriptional regulator [Gimibacter soli]WCL54179.1 LuxR C-terminal-related transcriptional regulator [Gimibacter soli]